MLSIRLPDGNLKQFDHVISVINIAKAIAPSLAKVAIAGKVDDELVDLSYMIDKNCDLTIITNKDTEGLKIIRHSVAHLLAHAVKRLFPTAQVAIGPVIENGFYYDFAFERAFTPEDLLNIEAMMWCIVKEDWF